MIATRSLPAARQDHEFRTSGRTFAAAGSVDRTSLGREDRIEGAAGSDRFPHARSSGYCAACRGRLGMGTSLKASFGGEVGFALPAFAPVARFRGRCAGRPPDSIAHSEVDRGGGRCRRWNLAGPSCRYFCGYGRRSKRVTENLSVVFDRAAVSRVGRDRDGLAGKRLGRPARAGGKRREESHFDPVFSLSSAARTVPSVRISGRTLGSPRRS